MYVGLFIKKSRAALYLASTIVRLIIWAEGWGRVWTADVYEDEECQCLGLSASSLSARLIYLYVTVPPANIARCSRLQRTTNTQLARDFQAYIEFVSPGFLALRVHSRECAPGYWRLLYFYFCQHVFTDALSCFRLSLTLAEKMLATTTMTTRCIPQLHCSASSKK